MTLNEIKQNVDDGRYVYWKTHNYQVIQDSVGQYLIHSRCNDCYWGLSWKYGTTLNVGELDFLVK